MSLTAAFEMQIASAFSALGNLVKDAKYKYCSELTRDPDTYELVQSFKEIPIKCVESSYNRHEVENSEPEIMDTDKKFLIPRKGLSVELITGAEIIIDEIPHEIIDIKKDPTGSLYTIQGRA